METMWLSMERRGWRWSLVLARLKGWRVNRPIQKTHHGRRALLLWRRV